jgi:putative toxin-antitoxin system antitoxin component (TIGR02293 family)
MTSDGIDAMSLAEPDGEDARIVRTVALLGGRGLLERAISSRLDAHDLLRDGLPGYALDHLVHHVSILRAPHQGNLEKAVGISLRTYQRRQEALGKPLSPEQSGRTWIFAEILARATDVFGSQDEAEQWLERPAVGLDQRRPIDLLSSPVGVEAIEDHLTRLEYGVYA